MNWWTAAIYIGAAVLALQGLFTLMMAHRQHSRSRIFEEEIQRREAEAAKASEPEAAASGQSSKAA